MPSNHLLIKSNDPLARVATPLPLKHRLLAVALLCGASTVALAEASGESIRSSESSVYSEAQIGASLSADALPDPATALQLVSSSDAADSIERHHPDWSYAEAWITDIGTLLYRDDDQDAYFAGFSLTIDADTRYQHTEVHAVIDVQRPFGAREFLHKTSTFSLYSNTLSDEYRVDIELVKNFSAGEYDLFIDLVDSNSHRILDSISEQDFSNLSALPLESEDFDLQIHTPQEPRPITQNDDVRVVEYAGGTGLFMILALVSLLLARHRLTLPGYQLPGDHEHDGRRGTIPTFILLLVTRPAAQLNTQGDGTGDGRLPARTSTLA